MTRPTPEALKGIPLFQGEAMLLGWNDSASRGMTVTFALHHDDTGEIHPFKGLGTGKTGQRFQIACIPIGDDEQPLAPPLAEASAESSEPQQEFSNTKAAEPPSKVSRLKVPLTLPQKVAIRCQEKPFINWILGEAVAREISLGKPGTGAHCEANTREDMAAVIVRFICRVASRKFITEGTEAARLWIELETAFLRDTPGAMAEER